MLLHHIGQQKASKRLFMRVLWTLLDCKKLTDGARNRNRTGTHFLRLRRILSPLCLPISPPGRFLESVPEPNSIMATLFKERENGNLQAMIYRKYLNPKAAIFPAAFVFLRQSQRLLSE